MHGECVKKKKMKKKYLKIPFSFHQYSSIHTYFHILSFKFIAKADPPFSSKIITSTLRTENFFQIKLKFLDVEIKITIFSIPFYLFFKLFYAIRI